MPVLINVVRTHRFLHRQLCGDTEGFEASTTVVKQVIEYMFIHTIHSRIERKTTNQCPFDQRRAHTSIPAQAIVQRYLRFRSLRRCWDWTTSNFHL